MIVPLRGFLTGTLIRLGDTGGGVILTPLLLSIAPLAAVVVIGMDIAFGLTTMALAGSFHILRGNFDSVLYFSLGTRLLLAG